MTILPSRPVTVNVARSGGHLGRTVRWEALAAPDSPVHAAAAAVAALDVPHRSPPRHPDAYSYTVTITADDVELLAARFRDPIPDELDTLLATLAAHHGDGS
jgi:hypothetical protein